MKANATLILETFADLGTMKATADRLGFSYGTVRNAVMRSRGLCVCGRKLDNGKFASCPKCRLFHRRLKKAKRDAAAGENRCSAGACRKPLSPSRKDFCDYHTELARGRDRRYQERQKLRHGESTAWRSGPWPKIRERILERDGRKCRACHKGKPRLHVHHRDHDNTNNVETNLVTLCVNCHGVLTRLLEHPDRSALLAMLG